MQRVMVREEGEEVGIVLESWERGGRGGEIPGTRLRKGGWVIRRNQTP